MLQRGRNAQMRVVVIEDGVLIRSALKRILENHGLEVVAEGVNGCEAIELYKKYKPDVLTLDITMPDMDGVEVLKYIVSVDPNAKVLIISSDGQDELIKKCMLNGAKYFITKPLNQKRVVQIIEKILAI